MIRQIRGGVLLVAGGFVTACGSPRDAPRPPDTLVVQPVAPLPAAPASASEPAPIDTLGFRLRAFVGYTASSISATLPELALIDTAGRRAGWDRASRRYLAELPGADYDSTTTTDNDDAPPGAAPAARGIESRELTAQSRDGERYILEVIASDAGTFVFNVNSFPNRGAGATSRERNDLHLAAGQVRRFAIRVARGATEVTEVFAPRE